MPTETILSYVASPTEAPAASTLVVVGRRARLESDDVRAAASLPAETWDAMLESVSPGDQGGSASTFNGSTKVVVGVLPEPCSRHNSPARPHAVEALVRGGAGGDKDVTVVLALDEASHALPSGLSVARALHRYSRKAEGGDAKQRTVTASFLAPEPVDGALVERIGVLAESVRMAAHLVDMPPSELHTHRFVEIAEEQAAAVGATIEVIRDEQLDAQGYGGLWGVGKAATRGPALVVLSCGPKDAERTLAWVGKGIVYDTGGLSIKGKAHMPGMKGDMGGAAAVLGAFVAAAKLKGNTRIHALLCLAENSVGPESTRPDDILSMYSGKTVEVNNTDAEGRLVLGDGVAHANKHLSPDVIVDLATLTGAQLMATGKRHAGIVTNDEDLEAAAVVTGRSTGELVHPLPYVPEFFRKEFKSEVADLKNSVKDRMNAQTSCAAQFVAEHLGDFDGSWLHVDLAGPSGLDNGRGTGYGVALLTELFEI
ncbi:MAG: leucyl aminopeptidase family protein [Deltaproteobacteria bacterium]|nr:leucyl aminopeptidase family protein [Deltaproteobacteria bacterium]